MSRDVELLTPYMQRKWKELERLADEAGIPFILTRTGSTMTEQIALYMQGREPLEEVNRLRAICNWAPLSDAQNKYCVTWTLASKHIIKRDDLDYGNDHSGAFDIALKKGGKGVHWDVKISANDNDVPDYVELGVLGESIGLVWGGRFKRADGRPRPDMPHFQQPEGISGFEEEYHV